METQLEIILSEELRCKNWAVVDAWKLHRLELIKAMESRGVIWNHNNKIKCVDQHM
jgi:hypothetical protein